MSTAHQRFPRFLCFFAFCLCLLLYSMLLTPAQGALAATDQKIDTAEANAYATKLVMAVQPNWYWPPQKKDGSLSVDLYLKIDTTGRILDMRVEKSSGNAAFDSSAISAIRVTKVLPPPPSPAFQKMILRFNEQ